MKNIDIIKQISNPHKDIKTYLDDLYRLLNQTHNRLAIAKMVGTNGDDDKALWAAIESRTFEMRRKINRAKDDKIFAALKFCMEEYHGLLDTWERYYPNVHMIGFDEVKISYNKDTREIVEVEGIPSMEKITEVDIKQYWFGVMKIAKDIMDVFDMPEIEMPIEEKKVIKIGKLTPQGAERLYQLCVERKVFEKVDRKAFQQGFYNTDEQTLNIKVVAAFLTLYRNSETIFTSNEYRIRFFSSFSSISFTELQARDKRKGDKLGGKQIEFAKALQALR